MSTTPKRKRGQHRARHPWSNAAEKPFHDVPQALNDDDCRRWAAYSNFGRSNEGRRAAKAKQSEAIYHYFMAGYRAGKDAK